jgi:DNA polymerase I-like protein with 3'-5' exonuclease and polymerase domains
MTPEMEQKLRELLKPIGTKLMCVVHDEAIIETPDQASADAAQALVQQFLFSRHKSSPGGVP